LLLLTASACVAGSRCEAQSPPAAKPDAKGPTAAVGAFMLAFNSHDTAAVGKLWTEGAVHISGDTGQRLEGRDKIAAVYAKLFAEDPKLTLTLQLGAPQLLAPTVARLEGVAHLGHSGGAVTHSGVSLIMVQENGKWLIAEARESDLPPVPAAAPQLAALDWLAGEWTGHAQGDQHVTLQLHWAPNRTFMMGRLEHLQGESVAHEVFTVVGWDAEHKSLRCWQFASDGGFAEGVWHADHPNQWENRLVAKFPDGRRGALTHVLTRTGPNEITLETIDRDVDGEPQPNVAAITLTRRGAATTPTAAPPAGAKPSTGTEK